MTTEEVYKMYKENKTTPLHPFITWLICVVFMTVALIFASSIVGACTVAIRNLIR